MVLCAARCRGSHSQRREYNHEEKLRTSAGAQFSVELRQLHFGTTTYSIGPVGSIRYFRSVWQYRPVRSVHTIWSIRPNRHCQRQNKHEQKSEEGEARQQQEREYIKHNWRRLNEPNPPKDAATLRGAVLSCSHQHGLGVEPA